MNKNTAIWLKGLLAAVIGGGSSAVVSGVTLSAIDPKHFNFAGELSQMLTIVGALFLTNGLISAFAYLKQSPVPPDDAAGGQ